MRRSVTLRCRSLMQLQALTIPQLRRVSSLIEDSIRRCNEERVECETERSGAMFEIGNLLHHSVIVSADEVSTATSRACSLLLSLGMYRISGSGCQDIRPFFESGSGQNGTKYRIFQPDSARSFLAVS